MNKPRRAKSRRLPPLPLDVSESKCGICLDEVRKRGKIGPCSHLYCFPCLLEWSKVNNTCPQCKVTFRCISRIDFKTDTFEDKVFIKDTTLRTGHVSSDEEYYHVNSSEIEEDSDPDFIDHTDIPNTLPDHDSEPEAAFTQRKRRCSRKTGQQRVTKRKAAIVSDTDSDDNDKIHRDIISSCSRLPELFEKSSPPPTSSASTEAACTGEMSCSSVSTTRNKKTPDVRSPQRAQHVAPNRTTSIYFTSPKYNKSARWASLDQKVKSFKRKRSVKRRKKPGIAISTLSPGSRTGNSTGSRTGNSTSKWLSTRSSRDKSDKENRTPPKSSVNSQFKVPFKKKNSPKKLYEDPEDYFASILSNEEMN